MNRIAMRVLWMPFMLRRLRYSFRLMFSSYFLGGVALAILFGVATVFIEEWQFAWATFDTVLLMHTIVLPLVTIIFTANAFAEELEERVYPLVWTYPIWKWALFVERAAALLLILAVYYGASILAVHMWLFELTRSEVWDLIRLAVPTHVFLGGLTMMFSLLGRSLLAGIVAGGGYWLMELITLGQWTKGICLFEPVWKLGVVREEVNRWWVFGLGLLWIVISLMLFMYGRRWLARK